MLKKATAKKYSVTAKDLEAGFATGTLSFAVVDGGRYPGCVGRDVVLQLSQSVSNAPQLSSEGSIRIVGFTMVGVITATALAFAAWVYKKRERKEVKMLQPRFLLVICLGVFIIGLSILSRSLLGWEKLSDRGQDIACMSTAWFLSMGFCLVISTMLAKLWRINKVASGAMEFRRTQVSAKSAVLNFSVQFVLNFILMLVWTLVDPMTYKIQVVEDEEWKLYGTCSNMGTAGWTFLGLTIGINFLILLLAVYQAYRARQWGDSYSESSGLGLAIFCWLQLVSVVLPVLFLIEQDNLKPRYFLSVSLVFACCMSMLLFIFVPLMMERSDGSRRSFGNFRMTSARLVSSMATLGRSKRDISYPGATTNSFTSGGNSVDGRATSIQEIRNNAMRIAAESEQRDRDLSKKEFDNKILEAPQSMPSSTDEAPSSEKIEDLEASRGAGRQVSFSVDMIEKKESDC